MHRSSIIYKWKQSKTVLNKYVCGFWCERTVDGLFHWGEHYYGLWTGISARNDNLKVKCLDGFVSYKCAAFHFIRCYLMDWNRVMDYWYFCISSLGSHSDGTHSLQRFHWGASNIILNFSGWRNKLIYILKRTIMNFQLFYRWRRKTHHPTCRFGGDRWGWVPDRVGQPGGPPPPEETPQDATLQRLHQSAFPCSRVAEQLEFDARLEGLCRPQLLDVNALMVVL